MKTYERRWDLFIPIPLDEAWDFFSSPLNLQKITPADMKFVVTSPYSADTKMYPGMIITYKVTPLLGIKLNWMTEITHVEDKKYFVDEQRFGPYALWHHQHHFKEVTGGVLMTDILNYAMPLGPAGTLANEMFVRKKINQIFEYREKAVKELFGGR
jgi:ligand-binding SRPBCC domain-containing protein